MTVTNTITPAIMIGGTGSRLWPLSRANKPKQFLSLGGPASMFQNTLMRFQGEQFQPAWLLAGADTLNHVTAQLDELSLPVGGIVIEPSMQGTAAAIATISLLLNEMDPEALVLVAPADHFIKDEDAFRDAVRAAAPIAASGAIITFGITPTAPETGFGYIAGSETVEVGGEPVGYRIGPSGFHEKPDLSTAQKFVDSGYYWNAGIFLFKASTMLAELIKYAPDTLAAVSVARADAKVQATNRFCLVAPEATAYARAPLEVSIDVAVMEKTSKAVVVPCRAIGWNDIGSLSALWETADKDHAGNAVRGDVLLHNSRNVLVHSSTGRKTVAAHLSDILIIDTEDALIVLPASEAQAVKTIVRQLKSTDAPQLRYAREATFVWGRVHVDHDGDEHASLSVTLKEGRRLDRRAALGFETWVLTRGAAVLTTEDSMIELSSGQCFGVSTRSTASLVAREDSVFAVTCLPLDGRRLEQLFVRNEPPEVLDLHAAAGREVA